MYFWTNCIKIHYFKLILTCFFRYLEYTENIQFQGKSLRVEYQTAEKCTTIDPETAEQIELMSSLGDKKSKLSLFGLLNKCLTRGSGFVFSKQFNFLVF